MGIATGELALQRRLTRYFIAADSLDVVLMRSSYTDDGEGGSVRGVAAARTVQTMRLIPLQDGAAEQLTSNGTQVSPTYMLLGVYDADMERWDRFTVDGREYEVVSINQNRQYETKGEVAYLGE
jgi:hypothetical protein